MRVTTLVLYGTPQDLAPALRAAGTGATAYLNPEQLGAEGDRFAAAGGTVVTVDCSAEASPLRAIMARFTSDALDAAGPEDLVGGR